MLCSPTIHDREVRLGIPPSPLFSLASFIGILFCIYAIITLDCSDCSMTKDSRMEAAITLSIFTPPLRTLKSQHFHTDFGACTHQGTEKKCLIMSLDCCRT